MTAEMDGARRVVLGPRLTVAEAEVVRSELLLAFEGACVVELDLGGLGEVDAAGLQVICASIRSARERGVLLSVVDVSRPARRAIELAGLSPHLEEIMPVTLRLGYHHEDDDLAQELAAPRPAAGRGGE